MRLEAKNVSYRYETKSRWILNDVSVSIKSGEKVGLVGSSGSGKSTLSKILSGYENPTRGQVLLDGKPIIKAGTYCPVQLVYQHPELAVNPRWKMAQTIRECWEPDDYILNMMGIEEEWMHRWPTELSGGELQRFCIARVLGPDTKFLICDEISTMLDVITQAQIWNLLLQIVEERQLGLIVVTHNMALADKVCDRIVKLEDLNH